MKRNKSFFLGTALVLMLMVCGVSISAFALNSGIEEIVIDETCGPTSYPLNDHPEILYKDNSERLIVPTNADGTTANLVTLDAVVDADAIEAAGGEIISSNYSTYSNFLTNISSANSRSAQVGDNRVVLVVEIYYPNGFEHFKVGLIENCVAVGIYDAETGDYLGGEFNTVEGDYSVMN